MDDRIESFRNGQLHWSELTARERERARLAERVIEETRAMVEAQVPPDLTAAVMTRIEGLQARPAVQSRAPRSAVTSVLFDRRRVVFEFRLAQVLAAAAAVILLAGGAQWYAALPASAGGPPPVFVQFRLHAPGAATVDLAGSFSEWRAEHALHETAPGVWVVTVPLESGIHDYSFVVDGSRWVADPYAPSLDDGFGGAASRLSLLNPESRS